MGMSSSKSAVFAEAGLHLLDQPKAADIVVTTAGTLNASMKNLIL